MSSSTSPNPSPTSQDPSPTSSSASPPHPTSSGITIPTTTVVAIGAGFVSFALVILGSLLFARFIRLYLRSRRDGVDWRQAWTDQGGVFGWLHGVSPREIRGDEYVGFGYGGRALQGAGRGDGGGGYLAWIPSGVGGGGWYGSELTRMRLWNDRLREERGGKDQGVWDGERPGLWEVRIGALGTGEDLNDEGKGLLLLKREGDESYDLVDYQPIAVEPTNKPKSDVRPKGTELPKAGLARIRLSVLISLPSPSPSALTERKSDPGKGDEDVENENEIPEMVIGSLTFSPTISRNSIISPSTRRNDSPTTTTIISKVMKKGGVEVSHVEYQDRDQDRDRDREGTRGAEWVWKDNAWAIEGLDEVDAKGV